MAFLVAKMQAERMRDEPGWEKQPSWPFATILLSANYGLAFATQKMSTPDHAAIMMPDKIVMSCQR